MPSFVSLNGIPAAIRGRIFDARLHELLLWCLPALLVGAVARGCILWHFPYGYVHPDTEDFLITADQLLRRHHFVLHGKKAFLAPVLFALPLLAHIPTLLVIPWLQHLFGLVYTLMMGELVRLWTRLWKVWIIPVTLVATLDPALLWYEQTLISEFQYLWCATALLLAGTACALAPSRWRFAALLGALLLTAGARPEGKLYVCFCLLLVPLIRWGPWRRRLLYGGMALVFCVGTWFSSRNTQAGLLLYATVLPLAPDVPRSAPGFAAVIDPLRRERLAQGPLVPGDLTAAEKEISPLVVGYLRSIHDRQTFYGAFCQRLAIEAALHRPLLLPVIALNKFLAATAYPPSGDFGRDWMQVRQAASWTYKRWMVPLMPRLAGPRLTRLPAVAAALGNGRAATRDAALFAGLKEAESAFIRDEYPPLDKGNAFTVLERAWAAMTTGARLGEQHYGEKSVPGMPAFYLLAAAGMLASLCRPGPLWRLHAAWVATLGFVFIAVMLTGVINPRYRFVFEPFCLLYIIALADLAAACFIRRRTNHEPIS